MNGGKFVEDEILKDMGQPVLEAFEKSYMASKKLKEQIVSAKEISRLGFFSTQEKHPDNLSMAQVSYKKEPFELPPLPPDPINETNEKLEYLNEQIDRMNAVNTDTSSLIAQLNDTVLKFLLGFHAASKSSTKTSATMLIIAVVSLVLTCAFSIASYISSNNDYSRLERIVQISEESKNISSRLIKTIEIQQQLIKEIKNIDIQQNSNWHAIVQKMDSLIDTNSKLIETFKAKPDKPKQ